MNALALTKEVDQHTEAELMEALDKCLSNARSIEHAWSLWNMTRASKPWLAKPADILLLRLVSAQRNEEVGGRSHPATRGHYIGASPSSLNGEGDGLTNDADLIGQSSSATLSPTHEEDVGLVSPAPSGLSRYAPSSSLNGEADGHGIIASNGPSPGAVASPTNSNGDGRSRNAANVCQAEVATPLLLNEDDAGQTASADNGRRRHAPSSSPNGDGVGLCGDASIGRLSVAAPSPTHRDTGGLASNSQPNGRSAAAVPYREPSSAELKGRLSAKFRVAERILTSLDTYAIGGKPVGDLTFAEARAVLDDKVEKSAVLRQILRHTANVSPNQRVRDVVKSTDLDEMIRKAKELVDVA